MTKKAKKSKATNVATGVEKFKPILMAFLKAIKKAKKKKERFVLNEFLKENGIERMDRTWIKAASNLGYVESPKRGQYVGKLKAKKVSDKDVEKLIEGIREIHAEMKARTVKNAEAKAKAEKKNKKGKGKGKGKKDKAGKNAKKKDKKKDKTSSLSEMLHWFKS